ncbi:MAG: ATP-binding cassette domain-containing protein [Clostridium sp.]
MSEIRNNIAYLPQNFKVYPTISGREFLELMAGLREINNSKNVIDEIIKDLEMEDYIDNKIGKYSGGMNQKLGIAQLLVGNPKLMIIDEPTVGLDPEQRNIIRETLNDISENRIVLVSTHIVEDIEVNCDNLIIMKKGKLLYQGDKSELINLYNDKAYKATMTNKEVQAFKKENIIISKKIVNDNWEVKYYSEVDNGHSKIELNLEEAYIICQNI